MPVIVCLGNPPYDRHEAADESNKARTGGWVRWGDDGKGTNAILRDFLDPALAAGHGGQLKWFYNLYVYFWRWALWKVFEHGAATGPGVVSFISASSYLVGDAFCGMREHMRRLCDEIWILDLGGEGRGTRKSHNVFAIETPVAIAIAARYGEPNKNTPAKVHYARMEGTRKDKLKALYSIRGLTSLRWQECPDGWGSGFIPRAGKEYLGWPLVNDLLPWQHSGCQFFRTWPIDPSPTTLKRRWRAMLDAPDRAKAFRESRDRQISRSYKPLTECQERASPIAELGRSCAAPPIQRYAFRSFDRQWVLADSRVGDYLRPVLWAVHGAPDCSDQVYVLSNLWMILIVLM